jgi:TFIIF-interacting CTD phosphatase-like protein
MVEFNQVKYILGSEHDDPELKELSNDVEQYFTEYLEAQNDKREYYEDLLEDKIDSYNTVMQLQKDDYKEIMN